MVCHLIIRPRMPKLWMDEYLQLLFEHSLSISKLVRLEKLNGFRVTWVSPNFGHIFFYGFFG